jgi:hypothetical protein
MAVTAPSITQNGRFEPFELQVSRRQIPNHRTITVFGYNSDLDQTEESIWPDGGIVPHGQAASVLQVSSSSASDAAAGVGARTVLIEGLDANYNEISEVVILGGQTAVPTTKTYHAINNMIVLSVGSTGHNVGAINIGTGTVTSGVPAVLWDLIGPTYNQRTTAHYTVPAGYTAYLAKGVFTAGQVSGSSAVTGKLNVSDPSGITRVTAITTLNNGSVEYTFVYPVELPEKYCFGASAIGSANNNFVSAMLNIVLIKNDATL